MKLYFIAALLLLSIFALSCSSSKAPAPLPLGPTSINDKINQEFRDNVVSFVREVSANHFDDAETMIPEKLALVGRWDIELSIYHQGQKLEGSKGQDNILASVLETAAKQLIDKAKLNKEQLEEITFDITINNPPHAPLSFVEHDGKGIETVRGLIVSRQLDKEIIKEKINLAKDYLLRVIDKDYHGAHKYYYATKDSFEERLHTIYTSSLVYTLLKMYDYEKDEKLWEQILKSADYILSMQNKSGSSKAHGAFHYSFFLDKKEKEQRYVVGTTSKTIFTLLELYQRTDDAKYLEAATLGAKWLLSMQNKDGSVKSFRRYRDEKWFSTKKHSMLYNGQVLSALSRTYIATQDEAYLKGAERIAQFINGKIEQQGCYLGDDYRTPNPISSSWGVLSLLDYYKASKDEHFGNLVYKCSQELIGRQLNDPSDIYRYGRWTRAFSSSGNGWLNEVLTDVYDLCKAENKDDCEQYISPVLKVTKWLMHYTYGDLNSHAVANPPMANGGIFWDVNDLYVRTDSVCHGVNAYVNIIDELDEGPLVYLPEPKIAWLQ